MGLHILIVGNPVDGLRFYGPFKTADAAVEAAHHFDYKREELDAPALDWWIAPLSAIAE